MRRGRLTYLLLVMIMVACKPTVPSEYIQPDDMEDILYDYHVAQAMAKQIEVQDANFNKTRYFLSILKKYDVTEADFDSSLVYYYSHVDRLQDIYKQVNQRLSDEATNLGVTVGDINRYSQYSATGDTANIWNKQSDLLLIPCPTMNRFDFTVDVDTTFHQGDSFMFQFVSEYLWQNGRYDEIRFTDVNDSVMQYAVDSTRLDSLRHDFEEYLKEVFAWCNTMSMEEETTPRDFMEVEAGDILVHPPLEGEDYGHAIVVVDVAKNAKGKVAIMCLEGNTPAREKHIVRNIRLWRNPWFVIDSNDREIKFIKSRFHRGQLRHY